MEGHRRVPEMPWETIPSSFRAAEQGPELLEQPHFRLLGGQPGRVGSDGSTHNEKHPTSVALPPPPGHGLHSPPQSAAAVHGQGVRELPQDFQFQVPRGVSHVGWQRFPQAQLYLQLSVYWILSLRFWLICIFTGAQAGRKQCIFILKIRMSLFWSRRYEINKFGFEILFTSSNMHKSTLHMTQRKGRTIRVLQYKHIQQIRVSYIYSIYLNVIDLNIKYIHKWNCCKDLNGVKHGLHVLSPLLQNGVLHWPRFAI